MRAAYLTGRIFTGLAAALIVVPVVASVVPARAELVVYDPGEVGSCGSVLFPTKNAGDDACEEKLLLRFGLAFFLPAVAIVLAGIGLAMVTDTYRKV